MGAWRQVKSPKLKAPLEMREMTPAGAEGRVWEVQELARGCVFKVTIAGRALPAPPPGRTRDLTDAEMERAVCLAVERAILTPPEKELGTTYEIDVTAAELNQAAEGSA